MNLLTYLGKEVKLELLNGFLYEGLVLDADVNSLTIKDKFGHSVTFSIKSILFIRETGGQG